MFEKLKIEKFYIKFMKIVKIDLNFNDKFILPFLTMCENFKLFKVMKNFDFSDFGSSQKKKRNLQIKYLWRDYIVRDDLSYSNFSYTKEC